MTKPLQLLLIFGGRSGEHEVSLMSARSVFNAIDPHKYQLWQLGITQDGQWLTGKDVLSAFENEDPAALTTGLVLSEAGKTVLYAKSDGQLDKLAEIDVIFPVLHGTYGEDGTLQGMLEILDAAYIGAGVLGSAVAMDKAVCKHVAMAGGIPILPYKVFNRSEIAQDIAKVAEESEKIAGYPLFVKPSNLGSSVGISKVTNKEELLAGLAYAARFDRRVLVERGINAREIEISLLGNDMVEASVPGEIVPDDIFYTYEDKYHHGEPEMCVPAPMSPERTQEVIGYAKEVYQLIDCSGMARVDFLIDKDTDELFFSEVNTIPGFTNISMYAKLWQASGLSYPQLIDKLVDLALERKSDRDQTVRKYED